MPYKMDHVLDLDFVSFATLNPRGNRIKQES